MEALLEVVDEETEYFLERGKYMPSKNHSRLEGRIFQAVSNSHNDQIETFIELSLNLPTGRVTPDLAFYEPTPSDWLEDEIRVSEPPLGVVEIVSPRQSNQDLIDKLDIYFGAGVKSCWIVIPTFKMINVFHSKHDYKTFMQDELYDEKLDIRLDLKVVFR
jgi:Uma2 family endonuclease